MNDEHRNNLDKLMEIARKPLIDKLEKALEENITLKEINGELLETLQDIHSALDMCGKGNSKVQILNQVKYAKRRAVQAICHAEEQAK